MLDCPRRTGLSALLDVVQANALLLDGDYGLRVERAGSTGVSRVVGAGLGCGIPLGAHPTWADLCRVLVRLRRTRRRGDPGRLLSMVDEGNAQSGAGARRGTVDSTPWRRVGPDLVERLASSKSALSDADALTDADGSVRFPSEPVRTARHIGTIDRTLWIQTEVDGVPLNRERALHQLHLRSRLASAVADDPLLRMHCATEPVPVAVLDTSRDTAIWVRRVEPTPQHPRYPGGTVAVSLDSLLRESDDGVPTLLRHVIDSRFERRTDALGYFLERFVRPLMRTFRLALDTHHIGLYGLDRTGVAFELSPELESTGRVVIQEAGVPEYGTGSTRSSAGIRRLVETLDALAAGFGRVQGTGRTGDILIAVRKVIAEEFRYLEQHTAEVLAGEHPLRCFVHSISPEQNAVLKAILRTVQERTRLRRRNSCLRRPTVVIDLDMCAIVPTQRLLDATRAVSGPRPGAQDGVPELAEPHRLSVLPCHARSLWRYFVDRNGLGAKYPRVDWDEVYEEFSRAFARSSNRLHTDTVSPGLARFVWDVRDAGGWVAFSTSRDERYRADTESVLAQAGVPHCPLLCVPERRTRPVAELRVEKLRDLGDVDVVAVFDAMMVNRMAITKEHSGARTVAVEVPGIVAERTLGQHAPDGAAVITTFETSPRPTTGTAAAGPSLSHTHSLEELQIGSLRNNGSAFGWSISLDEAESHEVVDSILADVDLAADRTGHAARTKFGLDGTLSPNERHDRTLCALHYVFTRKQFLKGSRSHYQHGDVQRDATPFLRRQRAIDVVLLGFPVKQCLNRLKACGPLPDLAEFGGLARLRELQRAVRAVYPPGLHFRILTDGRHFRPRPAALTGAYGRKLRQYADVLGIGRYTTIEDIDDVALRRIGPGLPAERAARVARHRGVLREVLHRFDITHHPLSILERLEALASEVAGPDSLVRSLGQFREMLMSAVYSVPMTIPPGVERLSWSKLVYADVYNLTDRSVTFAVRQARTAILRRAWHVVIRYLAVLRADEELGYDGLFPDRVRLTVNAVQPGRCGFTYLGGSGLLPWQGTGVLDGRGRVATDFLVSLLDQGFLPVYSALLGPRQPWFMVPAQHARPQRQAAPRGILLDEAFLNAVRLRRK